MERCCVGETAPSVCHLGPDAGITWQISPGALGWVQRGTALWLNSARLCEEVEDLSGRRSKLIRAAEIALARPPEPESEGEVRATKPTV